MKRIAILMWRLLQELADESAYRRHLRVHSLTHSAEAWRSFSDGRLRAKYARAKCC